jgi:hypothetical protein
MINLNALPRKANRAQFPANEIDPVQGPTAWIEAEDRNSEVIGSICCFRKNASTSKDQAPTSVGLDERRSTLHEFQSNVPSPVFDPTKKLGRIHIAGLARLTRCHDCVRGAEVFHPFPAKLDRLIVRGSARSWFRRHSHRSRLHPTTDGGPTRSPISTRPDPVGGES